MLRNFCLLLVAFRFLNEVAANITEVELVDNLTDPVVDVFIARYPIDSWKENGYFTLDYIGKINRHWLHFEPQTKAGHYTLAALYGVIMLFGLCGNFAVIFLFVRFKSLRTPANTLVVNLAISDFLMMSKMPIFIYNSIYMGPALGDIACRYYGFVGGLSGTCSICTLAAISLDRYYVVKFPLSRRFTGIRAKVCMIAAWLYGITFSCIPLMDIGLGSYTPEGFLTSCSFDYLTEVYSARSFILAFFVAAWVLPFLIIVFAYVNIMQVVIVTKKAAKQQMGSQESSRHMKVEEKRRQELRLSFVVFMVIMLWFAAWTPYAAVAILGIVGRADLISPLTSMIPALFCKSASCVDPFVYALTHPRFKAELVTLLRGKSGLGRRGTRMWTTQMSERRATFKRTDDESSDHESVVVSFKDVSRRIPSIKKVPAEMPVIDERHMQKQTSKFRLRWWFRPSFSNKSSSVRGLARTFTNRRREQSGDGDTTVSQSF